MQIKLYTKRPNPRFDWKISTLFGTIITTQIYGAYQIFTSSETHSQKELDKAELVAGL